MDEKELAALKESNPKAYDSYMSLKGEHDKLKSAPPAPPTPPPPPPDDPSLADKVRKEQEAKDQASKREKSLEGAIGFVHASKDFLKSNSGLLPKTIEGVFAQADKEKYDSAVDKANAIKVEIVKEFFSVQANLDLLTQTQKNEVEDFLKLTKNGKQDRIESMYSMVFEPTLETLRKVEKAKQLQIDPKNQSDAEKALTDKMLKAAKKHYLGDKE